MTSALARLVAEAAGWDVADLPPLPDGAGGRSTLTLAGLPFEVSTGAALDDPDARPARRYVVDLAHLPDPPAPGALVARQVAAVEAWAERAGLDAAPLRSLVATAFPAGATAATDAPFVLWLGAVHRHPGSGQVAALKVYACVEAAPRVVDRAGARWPEVATMAGLLSASVAPIVSVAATASRDSGPPALTLYRPVRRGYEHQALESLARAVGADAGAWTAALGACGLAPRLLTGPLVLSTRTRPGHGGVTVGIDLSLDAGGTDPLAGLRATVDALGVGRVLDDLLAWTAVTGRPLLPTWVGVEADGDRLVGLSLYGVPRPG